MKNFIPIGLLIVLFSFTFSSHLHAQVDETEFSTFSITRIGNQVGIDWTDEEKTINTTYEVQRASNDAIFQTIAMISSRDNIQAGHSYEFLDENPPVGIVQYKITQLVQNNSVQVYETLSLDMGSKGERMHIEKLASDKRQVSFHLSNPTASALQIHITSLNGQVLAEKKEGSGDTVLEISVPLMHLSAGMYFAKVRNVKGEIIQQKFLYQ